MKRNFTKKQSRLLKIIRWAQKNKKAVERLTYSEIRAALGKEG